MTVRSFRQMQAALTSPPQPPAPTAARSCRPGSGRFTCTTTFQMYAFLTFGISRDPRPQGGERLLDRLRISFPRAPRVACASCVWPYHSAGMSAVKGRAASASAKRLALDGASHARAIVRTCT